ncbi:hypothetical protein FGIG_07267 [Fasciola gigantica]|uniref:Uncharacterized protein n=1 Tax=Fasciola gigantica TaxID=46835 RepID=A0A504YFM7_FASGI|nr:hypothetical protein FGIG_07267 [Fasciola gigantica]
MVYGRQLMFPNTKLSATPEDQVVQDSVSQTSPANLDSTPWRLDLAAHAPAPIADADVDPTGQWLLTGSTDETAKVWCLSSGSLAFDTGIHGACVRSVCFRPVLDEPYSAAGHEWFIATGDDTGALRIWILPSKRLRKVKTTSMKLGQLNRSHSPDHLLYRRPNTMVRSEWHSSSSRHLNRLPSPDMQELERSGSRDARAAFFSNAAGFGGSWLRRLVWSPDGRLITGLSDRLCVWPFEAPNPRLAPSVPTRDRLGGDLLGPRLELKRCHVLRVLSSGFAERSTSALRMLSVGPRRQCCRPAEAETAVDPVLTDLPPTIVTVDVNTGTLLELDFGPGMRWNPSNYKPKRLP